MLNSSDPVLPIWPSESNDLYKRHIEALSLYRPNGLNRTASDISTILAAGDTITSEQISEVNAFWNKAIFELYGMKYGEFLAWKKKPDGTRMFSEQEIQQIGYMGIGTGGFAPLFDVSVLELIRLTIWQYSSEMEAPNLHEFAPALIRLIRKADLENLRNKVYPPNSTILMFNRSVIRIVHNRTINQYGTGYGFVYTDGAGSHRLLASQLILAMHHKAVVNLFESSISRNDCNLNTDVIPYYDNRTVNLSGTVRPELERQNSMNASKIFITMPGPAFTYKSLFGLTAWAKAVTTNVSDATDKSIRAQFRKLPPGTPLGTTYTLPSPYEQAKFSNQSRVIGLHYAWGADADAAYETIRDYSTTISDTGIHSGRGPQGLLDKIFGWETNRISNITSQNGISGNPDSGLCSYFSSNSALPALGPFRHLKIIYWPKVKYICGGFKLDAKNTGAHMVYQYRTAALAVVPSPPAAPQAWDWGTYSNGSWSFGMHESTKNLFFAGCSFSHYGGWIEGAFQSALGVAAGVLYNRATAELNGMNIESILSTPDINMLIKSARNPYKFLGGPNPPY